MTQPDDPSAPAYPPPPYPATQPPPHPYAATQPPPYAAAPYPGPGQPPAGPQYGPPPYGPPAYTGYPPPPYTGYPAPPTPPRSRVGLWIGLGAGLLVLVLAAGLGAFALVRMVGRQAAAAEPTGPVTTGRAPLDLFALMMERPTDAVEADTTSDDGTLTIDQMAQWWNDPGVGLERLEARGFVAGAQRAWESKDRSLVQITLVELATDIKAIGLARDFLEFYTLGVDKAAAAGGLPTVAMGRYVIDSEENSDGQFHASALFTRGPVLAFVDAYYPRVPPTDTFVDLALDQYNRLPSG